MELHNTTASDKHGIDLGQVLSYQGLVKRAEFLKLAVCGALKGIQFKKLEEKTFGKPFRRSRKAAARKS